mmetsp:Transcript_43350/g.137881  ORF Transcript_43350/g.137881 Transcript_43350/m.137881 type:complete len:364 (+) Transcript_43350:91-1182(+)
MAECNAGNPLVLGGAGACVVTSAVLALCSLGAVPPLNYGIRYSYFTKQAEIDNVYSAGRHFIGPFSSFLLFPADVRNIEFSNEGRLSPVGLRYPALHTRTKEGLALHMQVSLQYRLRKAYVGRLYGEFNVNYETMFISTIRDRIIQVAAEYQAAQLWRSRVQVGQRMQAEVNAALNMTYAECWGLQLMVIELPSSFDAAIVATQVQEQNVSTMEYDQKATQIRAQTSVIAAEYDRKVKVIKAHGRANYTLQTKKARAEARSKTLNVEADMLEAIKGDLSLTPDDVVEYQQYTAIQMLQNASIFYGFEEGTQVLMQPPHRRLSESSQTDVSEARTELSQAGAPHAPPDYTGQPSGRHRRLGEEL